MRASNLGGKIGKLGGTMNLYRYTVGGTAAGGQTWEVSGTIEIKPSNFAIALEKTMQFTFDKLTAGNAVYGKPGEGCSGPYDIRLFVLEREFL
jgi:hypothetical protein